jgi:hypothetical protein
MQAEDHGWDAFQGSLFGRQVVWVEGNLTKSRTIYFSTADSLMLVGLFNGESREIQ